MAEPKFIQESDLEKAVRLDKNQTIAEALKRLEQEHLEFAVVQEVGNAPIALISKEQLHLANSDEPINSLLPYPSGLIVVELGEMLDRVAQKYGKDLELRPNLAGVVVIERNEVRGILPRQMIVSQAARVVTRGAGTSYLEGSPIDYVIYECPEDHERKFVDYYNPQNPPRCQRGHLMQIIE